MPNRAREASIILFMAILERKLLQKAPNNLIPIEWIIFIDDIFAIWTHSIEKLQCNLTKPVKFIVIYQTKKINYFLPKNDKILDVLQNNLISQFTCPGCNMSYILKTERNLTTRLSEHLDPLKSAISKHLIDCDNNNYLLNMNNLFDNLNDSDSSYSNAELVPNNIKILH
jgi:hypothetical protein